MQSDSREDQMRDIHAITDEFAKKKVDLSGICWNPKPRMTPYGEQDDNGVDVSLIRQRLMLTPTERIERMQRAINEILYLRQHVRRIP